MDVGCFDIHQHVGLLAIGSTNPDECAEDEPAVRLRVMARHGIDAAAVTPSFQFTREHGAADTRRANDAAAAYRDASPERFPAAIGTVDPLTGVPECKRELHRIAGELAMAGVCWHHRFQGVFASDERMQPLLEQAGTLGLPVFFHLFAESTMESPHALDRWARDFPDLTFVALDALSSFTQSRDALEIGARRSNVVFETAATFPIGRLIPEFVNEFGSRRVVFGSDLYTQPLSYDSPNSLLEIRAADVLSDEQRHDVLAGNALRILRLDRPPQSTYHTEGHSVE